MTDFEKKAQAALERLTESDLSKRVGVQFKKTSSSWLVKILGLFVPSMKTRSMALGRTVYISDHLWETFEYLSGGGATKVPAHLWVTSLLSVVAHELAHIEQRFFGETTIYLALQTKTGSVTLALPTMAGKREDGDGLNLSKEPRSLLSGFFRFDLPYLLLRFPLKLAEFRARAELCAELAAVTSLRYIAADSLDGKNPGFGYSGELETFREQVKNSLNAYAFMVSSSSYFWAVPTAKAQEMAKEFYDIAGPLLS